MLVRESRKRPLSWEEYKRSIHSVWVLPFHTVEWVFQWTAYLLSRWAFLEVLEYLSVLSVLFAVVSYYSEAGDRKKQKHYQAWQVINTSQGKGGAAEGSKRFRNSTQIEFLWSAWIYPALFFKVYSCAALTYYVPISKTRTFGTVCWSRAISSMQT